MSKLVNDIVCEDSKAAVSFSKETLKAPKRKYKQKMSLWSKSKRDASSLSVDVSTKSSQGYSSMGVLASNTSSVSPTPSLNFLHIHTYEFIRNFAFLLKFTTFCIC